MKSPTIGARLASKLKSNGECLEFQGARFAFGYGKLWDGNGVTAAHRVAYQLENGPIPSGFVVRHTCDNPSCCNPKHLLLGTQADNLADMTRRQRRSQGAGHSAALRRGWSPDLRAMQAETTTANARRSHASAAAEAGVPPEWKRCPKCEEWKPMTDYYKNSARYDGVKPSCKPCSVRADMDRRSRQIADPT